MKYFLFCFFLSISVKSIACSMWIKAYVNNELITTVTGSSNLPPQEINVEWGDLVVLVAEVYGSGTCQAAIDYVEDVPWYKGTEPFCGSQSSNEHLSEGSFGSTLSNGEYGYCTLGAGERRIRINRLTTGIEEDLSNQLNVFPNPAQADLRIEKTSWEDPFDYEIFNLNAQVVLDGSIGQNTVLNVSDLPTGNYLLHMRNESGVIRKKIVIQ